MTKKLFVFILVCVFAMNTMACSTAWIGEAEQIVAALLPAAANLITLISALQGKGIPASDLAKVTQVGNQVQADLQLVSKLVADYKSADAAAKPGKLGEISAAINTAQADLASLLPALHISDPATQAKVTAIVGLISTEIASIAAIVPLVNPSASPAMVKLAERQAIKTPPMTGKQFTKAFNRTMTTPTGNAELDRVSKACTIKSGWSVGKALGEAFGRR